MSGAWAALVAPRGANSAVEALLAVMWLPAAPPEAPALLPLGAGIPEAFRLPAP